MIIAFLTQSGIAHAFTYTYEGKTLKYLVIDKAAKTCEVQRYDTISGTLIIPAIAKDGENEYTVTSIGVRAFQGRSGLTSVTIPNSVTSIEGSAFGRCTGLTSVNIGNSVTSIGNDAFKGCTGLTSVTIPNSVTSIGENTFRECSGLTSIKIGKSVNSISSHAFLECDKITDVICLAEKVPTLDKNAFSENIYGNATLHVLKGSINDYKATSPWSLFFNIVGDAEVTTGVEGIESDEMTVGQPAEYYNLQGVRIAEPKKGELYLRKQGNKTEKIIMR